MSNYKKRIDELDNSLPKDYDGNWTLSQLQDLYEGGMLILEDKQRRGSLDLSDLETLGDLIVLRKHIEFLTKGLPNAYKSFSKRK